MDSNADKILKKTLREQQKRLKPSECLKYVRIVVDGSLLSTSTGQELLVQMNNEQLKYEIRKLVERNCIFWERSAGQRALVSNEEALDECNPLSNEWEMESEVVKVLTDSEIQTAVKTKTIGLIVEQLKISFPEKNYTIAVPKFKGDNILNALIELQVVYNVNVRVLDEGKEDLASLLRCFNKAIAEAPYKKQKNEKLGTFKKYLANDKKQCVRVEGRNGYGRLWQQHLNRLPMVTLEVAETIISQYPNPKKLLDAYDQHDENDGANLLADLRIQRSGPQPLQTDRRVGNVLSQKLHTLYTTRDPNMLI